MGLSFLTGLFRMSIHPDPDLNRLNVLGQPLASCCFDPLTGYYRDGFCHTGFSDYGLHTVCAQMTSEFLAFSQAVGNDLITPLPEMGFAGLTPGDLWCICVTRWVEAWQHGVAPPVKLAACHESVLQFVDLATLRQFAL